MVRIEAIFSLKWKEREDFVLTFGERYSKIIYRMRGNTTMPEGESEWDLRK